jgi:hypothetical protein
MNILGDLADYYIANNVYDRTIGSSLFKRKLLAYFTKNDKVDKEKFYQNLIDQKIVITEYKFKVISNNGQRFDKKKEG